jgi:hypothetical protein
MENGGCDILVVCMGAWQQGRQTHCSIPSTTTVQLSLYLVVPTSATCMDKHASPSSYLISARCHRSFSGGRRITSRSFPSTRC